MRRTGVVLLAFVTLMCCNCRLVYGEEKMPEGIQIDLIDATASDFADLINRTAGEGFHVVCTKAALDIVLPDIQGLNCSPEAALRLLQVLTENTTNPLIVREEFMYDPIDYNHPGVIFIIDTPTPASPIVRSVVNVHGALMVLRSSGFLDSDDPIQNLNEGSEILEETLKFGMSANFSGESTLIKMKYHKESGLLFLEGSREQVEFVKEIITELEASK